MKKERRKKLFMAAAGLAAFALWTVALCFVNVQAIGPLDSEVGFASMNRYIHGLTGVHMALYVLTDWLGLVPVAFAMGFAMLGLLQWIRRKSLWKVDGSLLVLGGFYLLVMVVYVLFEVLVINYRPVLIGGRLEASYPSSTTVLVLCVMPTAIMQLNQRIKKPVLRHWAVGLIRVYTVFMVFGRLVSGVHWFSDILGGMLLSGSLGMLYRAVSEKVGPECR